MCYGSFRLRTQGPRPAFRRNALSGVALQVIAMIRTHFGERIVSSRFGLDACVAAGRARRTIEPDYPI